MKKESFERRMEIVNNLRNNSSVNRNTMSQCEEVCSKTDTSKQTEPVLFKGFKLRLLMALVLFCGFLYLDLNKLTIQDFTSDKIADMITLSNKTSDWTNLWENWH